jgi:hypothetical protein
MSLEDLGLSALLPLCDAFADNTFVPRSADAPVLLIMNTCNAVVPTLHTWFQDNQQKLSNVE